jgi:hypothetical protein
METSLHRDLKAIYAGEHAQTEVRLGRYRIDVVDGSRLIEIQHGSLAAIRRKLVDLLASHQVHVVKPIIMRKTLVKRRRANGRVAERRLSPKRGSLVDLFEELVYIRNIYPHPRLSIEAVLVEIEEWRLPGHGRRRRWRRSDHIVEDQKLLSIHDAQHISTAADLELLLPGPLPRIFDTKELATHYHLPRHVAQRIAYCLREMRAVVQTGKRRNSLVYEVVQPTKRGQKVA